MAQGFFGGNPDYSAPYFEERDKARQRVDQQAAQAAAIAEMLGYYTPELQQKVTQPLGYNPTIGESLLGAPVRGLGKAFGSERLQQVGAQQPFNLGQVQPQVPPGTDPQTRELLKSIGLEMGMQPAGREQVISGVPSEVSGQPRLRTKTERDAERYQQEKMWELITRNYKTEQDRRLAESQIQQNQAAAELNFSTSLLNQQKFQQGPTKTETQAFLDSLPAINEERIARGKQPWTYFDMQLKLKQASKSPASKAAKIQWFELAQEYGFGGTPLEFEQMLAQAKWDPLEVANKIVHHKDSIIPFMPEHLNEDGTPNTDALQEFKTQLAIQLVDSMEQLNQKRRASGESGLWRDEPTRIPPQLKASGVSMDELQQFMRDFSIPTIEQAIQMYMDVYNEQEAQRKK